ncbi:MAG: tRNA (guanosine(37)-N1)-methyltransferase TrmD [Candidatus Pacebacteria bacterium]|nr:tRNA (guanosine(37)-N1)-methyltransferase TrmD [Candidatus Paceibacterota bacterium]
MINFEVITLFPEFFAPYKKSGILKNACDDKLIDINIHNLRDFTTDKRKTVDDKPFGGGVGMVMMIEPIFKAVESIKKGKSRVILFTPRGKKYDQKTAHRLSKTDQIIMICGRYEGVDERVAKHIADEEISIGDYVLMGGEIPAMVVIESVSRLVPMVVGTDDFLKKRTKSVSAIEYPQFTRPAVYGKWAVPSVLLSGDHKRIEEWRDKNKKIL